MGWVVNYDGDMRWQEDSLCSKQTHYSVKKLLKEKLESTRYFIRLDIIN